MHTSFSLTLVRLQNLLAQPDRLRRHFHELILLNEFNGLFQIQKLRRNQPNGLIRGGSSADEIDDAHALLRESIEFVMVGS